MIAGADNIELAEYCPVPLTTYDQMAYASGEACAAMILRFPDRQAPRGSVCIPPELHVRDSA